MIKFYFISIVCSRQPVDVDFSLSPNSFTFIGVNWIFLHYRRMWKEEGRASGSSIFIVQNTNVKLFFTQWKLLCHLNGESRKRTTMLCKFIFNCVHKIPCLPLKCLTLGYFQLVLPDPLSQKAGQ